MLIDFLHKLHEGDDGGTGQGAGESDKTVEKPGDKVLTMTQAEYEARLKERLEQQRRSIDAVADKKRKEQEDAALAEQGKYKELAEQHAAKVNELTPYKEAAERAEKALEAQVSAMLAELPNDMKTVLEPLLARLSAVEKLEYLTANRDKFVSKTEKQKAPNINGGETRKHTPTTTDADRDKYKNHYRNTF